MLIALELFPHSRSRCRLEGVGSPCERITQALAEFKDVRTEVQVPPFQCGSTPACKWTTKNGSSSSQMADKLRDDEPSIEVVPGSRRELVIGVLDDAAGR